MPKKHFIIGSLLLALAVIAASPAAAQTIYRKNYNNVKLIKLDKKVAFDGVADQPYTVSPEKMHNMLASLRFDRARVILKDVDEVRLLDPKGIKLLTPYLVEAFKLAGPDQMVSFTYIKKAPKWKVIRNDRLISAKMFVRNGDLYISFRKLYAKIFGDYQREGKGEQFFNRAKDVRVSLAMMPGQRTIGAKFIALKIDHDYLVDLKRQEAEDKDAADAKKREKEVGQKVSGVPLPDSPREKNNTAQLSGDAAKRLETLEELHKKKLISNKEYNRKRKEIIGDI